MIKSVMWGGGGAAIDLSTPQYVKILVKRSISFYLLFKGSIENWLILT
jgi:hypothetical protein